MKKKKILLVPLDERPCNYSFPANLPASGYELIVPPASILGDKKTPAGFGGLRKWILDNIKGAYGIILSLDMLIYGGIVPSRLHFLQDTEIRERINLIDEIKAAERDITIYAFQLIMRCPSYSSSDEEPDYYEDCGREIHLLGKYRHMETLNKLTDTDRADMEKIQTALKPAVVDDYLTRRAKNIDALLYTLSKVKSGLIDYFVVPQDDTAVYGFPSQDQIKVREFIKTNTLHLRAGMYPGADEVGLSLLARFICRINNVKPRIYVHYASSKGGLTIPSFEDRMIDETIKHQIYAAGGVRVYSLPEADILLAVNIGSDMSGVTEFEKPSVYDINRNLAEFTEYIKYAMETGKAVAVGDVAYGNWGELEFVRLLQSEGLLYRLSAYAGWNTSSNTLGTAICQAIACLYEKDDYKNSSFLTLRYLEDVCYCGHTRWKIVDEQLPALGLNYFDAGSRDGEVARLVREELLSFCKQNLPVVYDKIESLEVTMPWKRMFEVGIKVTCRP